MLSEYNADIKYVTGKANLRADVLSRLPADPSNVTLSPCEWQQLDDLASNVHTVAAQDSKFINAVNTVQSGDPDMDEIDRDQLPSHAHDDSKAIPLAERLGGSVSPQLMFPNDHAQFYRKLQRVWAPLQEMPIHSSPGQTVAIDVLRALPKSSKGNKYLLTFPVVRANQLLLRTTRIYQQVVRCTT